MTINIKLFQIPDNCVTFQSKYCMQYNQIELKRFSDTM